MSAKPRSDSKLKNLSEDQQALIISWCNEKDVGYAGARDRCLNDLNLKVSLSALCEFWKWWHLQQRFYSADSRALQTVELLQRKGVNLSPEKIRELGQTLFTIEAVEEKDPETFVALENLQLARDSAAFKGKIETEKLKLNRQKYQRLTCKNFLDWLEDKRAMEIANGSGTNSEKIEALGQAMFGEDWN